MAGERFPIFRMTGPWGQGVVYNTANHETVKDEATARAAFMEQFGEEPSGVASYTFDEMTLENFADFARFGA